MSSVESSARLLRLNYGPMTLRRLGSMLLVLFALQSFAQGDVSPMALFHQQASGTSLMPASAPMEMRMFSAGHWHVMLHGVAFLTDLQQSGPRGGDDQFSTNWIMAAASRPLGRGALMFRGMLS